MVRRAEIFTIFVAILHLNVRSIRGRPIDVYQAAVHMITIILCMIKGIALASLKVEGRLVPALEWH